MTEQHVLAPSIRAVVQAHYERTTDLITANFPLVPVVPVRYPDGLDGDAEYDAPLHFPVPSDVPTIVLGDGEHRHRYPAMHANTIRWFLAERGAIDFDSWTPSSRDPESVGYARIIVSPRGGATHEHVSLAMLALRTALLQHGVEAIPVLDGHAGAALFIPFNDVPTYEAVRAWLHTVANAAVSRNETLLTADPHDQQRERVHVNVGSNAAGRFSSLPYALIGAPHLGMVTPIRWNELGVVHNGHYTAANSAQRLAEGDVFHRLARELAHQRFADAVR